MLYDNTMILDKNPKLKKKIDEIIYTNQVNTWAAGLFNEVCNYTDFFSKDKIDNYVKQGLKEEAALVEIIYDEFNFDKDDEETRKISEEYCVKQIKCLDPKPYLDDLYVKTISANGRYDKYALKMIKYEPYQTFAYDEIEVTKDYKEYSRIGYFKKPFSYLALTEGNNIWMSLNPNEIETMKPFVNKAHGNVLVLGLGMGYVPFMMANKSEVKHITIIERDEKIIKLFNNVLFPHFINKNKITIIKDDAIKYTSKNNKYNYIFADLWHNPEDGLDLFIKLKRINKNIDCWLDVSLAAMLRRCMITLIEESLEGLNDNNYKKAKNTTDRVINHYYEVTKNLVINNEDDLLNLLSDESLINLAIK